MTSDFYVDACVNLPPELLFSELKKKVLQLCFPLGGESTLSEVHLSGVYIPGRVQQSSCPA